MKQLFCIALAFLLLCGCLSVAAADEALKDVHCEEQGFSTKAPVDKHVEWEDGVGLCISVEEAGYVPYVAIYRRPEKLKNPVNFLNNVYREYMENRYGDSVGTNPCKSYEIGGKTLYAAQYHYEVNGNQLCLALMIEVRDDGDVEYHAKFVEGKGEAALAVLDTAVRYYQPDAAANVEKEIAADQQDLVEIHCDEQGYTTRMPAGLSTTWQEGNGLRVWVDEPGYVPNVLIWRRQTQLEDPEKYVKEEYANSMRAQYGSNLVGITQHEYYEAGGKRLLATSYIYKGSSGAAINQIHLVEVRADGDVEYTARFLNSQREATLAALDAAVRYYQPDAAAAAAPAAAGTGEAAIQLKTEKVKPIVSGTQRYSDDRFSMKLPENWQVMTQGEYMTFCFKAWDPANPNRTIFMFMKLEPFLKSWAAKAKYQQVNDSLGGNSIYKTSADAPVMESCTLKGLLDSLPQVYDFCDKYYSMGLTISPNIIPQITKAEIVEATPSTLPAPATCKENVIGRISYQDYLGQPCEGLVTAQPVDAMKYDFFGVDGWPYTVYLFMGVTSPVGEMQELEGVLTECLGSFNFEQSYVQRAIDLSNSETQALLAQGRAMQAAHDAMVNAWYAREQAHDISFQKWSDSFMGYDRLYDSSTGEVYLASVGFYDAYDLHREEYSNSNLQLVDKSSEQYYLRSADYYINP